MDALSYKTEKYNPKESYTPEEMMWAIKHKTIDEFIGELLYDDTGKYAGIFENKEE